MKRSAWRYLWTAQDVRRKLIITVLILAIYRLVSHVPVPGANPTALATILQGSGPAGSFVGILDLLSGGTVSNFSVLAMGVYPYITAQIILQLLVPIIPALQKRMEEDPREGQKWMEKWTYILAVPMAALQAIGQINIFNSLASQAQLPAIISNFSFAPPYLISTLTILTSMTAGTMFAIWLGELISEFGIRNQGLSLIIFSGIVSRIPQTILGIWADQAHRWFGLIFMVIITTLVVFAIVFVQQGRRNVPVMYPGRRVGSRMSMPVKGTLPLMVNMAGMIPLIFAQSLLTFPSIIASYFINSSITWVASISNGVYQVFSSGNSAYWVLYFLFVVGFSFFYTDVLFAQQNYGENLKKVGAQIPGVSRGAPTQRYLTKVLRRITLPGALFLGIVAILPFLVSLLLSALGVSLGSQSNVLLVTSAGLLIVVGVVRDTFFTIDAELKLHGYDETLLVH
jgi:preprotein translocase subunit SecY